MVSFAETNTWINTYGHRCEDFREDLELFGEIIGALQKEAKIGQG
jgi:hypothetical protein